MKMNVDAHLIAICQEIIKDEGEAMIPSDDLLNAGPYVGGYETIENAFCFSVRRDQEYWFQITLDEAKEIAEGRLSEVEIRPAE